MLNKKAIYRKLSKQHAGFTIVEVMIVIAIVALIMVIVFLAVPAVQRSTRNNARKQDAYFIAAQRLQYDVSSYTSATFLPPGGYDCSPPITGKLFCSYLTSGLSYYNLSNVIFHSNQSIRPSVAPTVNDTEHILTDTYLVCDGHDATSNGAKPTDMVVLFMAETGGSGQQVCLDSEVYASASN